MIQHHQWLQQAQALPIGMQVRIRHGQESRMNLTIANDRDKWWCYCHRCHDGAVMQKDHVLLLGDLPTPEQDTQLPEDIALVSGSEYELTIARFLATKNMDAYYLPAMYYSAQRKRLMLRLDARWHGRDLTGRSPQKWMNYEQHRVITLGLTDVHIVVEDIFSMYKVRWALRHERKYSITCALGTNCSDALMGRMSKADRIMWFFDADSAGDSGSEYGMRRMRPFVHKQKRVRPPEKLDPKDMSCADIQCIISQGERQW